MEFSEYRGPFLSVTLILALIVALPALNRLLVLPRTGFFTELWILDSTHSAGNYSFNISPNGSYTIFLGLENYLGCCAYYSVEVKFRNQTQSAADGLNRTASSLESLFTIRAFVADLERWELPLTFSFDYEYMRPPSSLELRTLTVNNFTLDIRAGHYTIAWDLEHKGYFGNLFFELWIYDSASNTFQYHERSVGLWLNMTDS